MGLIIKNLQLDSDGIECNIKINEITYTKENKVLLHLVDFETSIPSSMLNLLKTTLDTARVNKGDTF